MEATSQASSRTKSSNNHQGSNAYLNEQPQQSQQQQQQQQQQATSTPHTTLSRKPTLKVNNSEQDKPTPILKSESKVNVITGTVIGTADSTTASRPSLLNLNSESSGSGVNNVKKINNNSSSSSSNFHTSTYTKSNNSINIDNSGSINAANNNSTTIAPFPSARNAVSSFNLHNDENSNIHVNTGTNISFDPTTTLKRTSSLSFNEPSEIAKSRRGSISTHPSNVSLSGASVGGVGGATSSASGDVNVASIVNPNRHHPQTQLNQQRAPAALNRNPSGLQNNNNTNTHHLLHSELGRNPKTNLSSDALQFTPRRHFPGDRGQNGEVNIDKNVQGNSRNEKADEINKSLSAESVSTINTNRDYGNLSEADANLIKKNLTHPKKPKIPKAVITADESPKFPFTKYFQKTDDNKIHVLLGASGSVATIKIPELIDKIYKTFSRDKVSIQLVLTKYAEHFLKGFKIPSDIKIWRDQDEWFGYNNNDPILHVELRKWADIFIVAPVSANTLAKIANGIADNLLTSIFRAWNPANPIVIAPAMNTFMYTHPVTKLQLEAIKEFFQWIKVLKPVEKILVCGDIGMGGMTTVQEIALSAKKELAAVKKKKQAELREQQNGNSGNANGANVEADALAEEVAALDLDEEDEDKEIEELDDEDMTIDNDDDDDNDDDEDDDEDEDEDDDDDEDEDEDEDEEDFDDNTLQRVNTRTKLQKRTISEIPEEEENDDHEDESNFHDADENVKSSSIPKAAPSTGD